MVAKAEGRLRRRGRGRDGTPTHRESKEYEQVEVSVMIKLVIVVVLVSQVVVAGEGIIRRGKILVKHEGDRDYQIHLLPNCNLASYLPRHSLLHPQPSKDEEGQARKETITRGIEVLSKLSCCMWIMALFIRTPFSW